MSSASESESDGSRLSSHSRDPSASHSSGVSGSSSVSARRSEGAKLQVTPDLGKIDIPKVGASVEEYQRALQDAQIKLDELNCLYIAALEKIVVLESAVPRGKGKKSADPEFTQYDGPIYEDCKRIIALINLFMDPSLARTMNIRSRPNDGIDPQSPARYATIKNETAEAYQLRQNMHICAELFDNVRPSLHDLMVGHTYFTKKFTTDAITHRSNFIKHLKAATTELFCHIPNFSMTDKALRASLLGFDAASSSYTEYPPILFKEDCKPGDLSMLFRNAVIAKGARVLMSGPKAISLDDPYCDNSSHFHHSSWALAEKIGSVTAGLIAFVAVGILFILSDDSEFKPSARGDKDRDPKTGQPLSNTSRIYYTERYKTYKEFIISGQSDPSLDIPGLYTYLNCRTFRGSVTNSGAVRNASAAPMSAVERARIQFKQLSLQRSIQPPDVDLPITPDLEPSTSEAVSSGSHRSAAPSPEPQVIRPPTLLGREAAMDIVPKGRGRKPRPKAVVIDSDHDEADSEVTVPQPVPQVRKSWRKAAKR
ncbi:hypothetical protein BXZ70DRAFT_186280 [Cristinia sonorae]|uniref:Uncharacterized protein n=1 Tax=Cristinia sonorae TaxID=1940300 RepID=A0A8K0UN72_9AGAR|nr:hypothetical protein BXZ70DRAFT_186280 [Cristinia sonorae]